ncbi:hypothetical protein Tco_0404001 [Tanacetum coccineum]
MLLAFLSLCLANSSSPDIVFYRKRSRYDKVLLIQRFSTSSDTTCEVPMNRSSSLSINFALIISPTIYASYIEQFLNTASLKTINSEKQIHAKVNGKVVVVSESLVWRDLHLNDEDGTACLTVNENFKILALMGYETASNKLTFYKVATATASQPPKDPNTYRRTKKRSEHQAQDSDNITKTKSMTTLNEPHPQGEGSEGHTSGSGEGRIEHQFELTANVPITPHDSSLLGGYIPRIDEGRLKLQELMTMCTKLSKQVLDLEKEKDAEAVEILKLKKRVKRLERQRKFDDEIVDAATTGVSTASAPVTTVGAAITTAEPRTPSTTTTVFDDEDVTMAMAQTQIKMKEEKAKEKGVAFKDVEDSSRPVRSITTLQPLPSINPKDKGKSQRKFRASQRDAEIRSRPPTKTQLRNLMMTYLKNMGGYKHSQLKGKTYEEIQGLYKREQKFIHDFVPMDSKKEEKKSMKPESEGKKSKRLKRIAGSYTTQKSPKKPKVMKSVKNVTEEEAVEYKNEKEELRLSLKIISGDDNEVNYEPLSRRFPIMNWEYKLLGNVDAKDMQDLNGLYRLVQERFQDHPLKGYDLLLWGDLRILFDLDEKDELWMNQLD